MKRNYSCCWTGLHSTFNASLIASRAVAPTAAAGQTYAERRRQAIQESKYLGGDMQHTHLVKGLDYALLEKMRTEIQQKEREEDELDELEEALEEKTKEKGEVREKEDDETKLNMKTTSGRNIYRVLFRSRLPDRNELFQVKILKHYFLASSFVFFIFTSLGVVAWSNGLSFRVGGRIRRI